MSGAIETAGIAETMTFDHAVLIATATRTEIVAATAREEIPIPIAETVMTGMIVTAANATGLHGAHLPVDVHHPHAQHKTATATTTGAATIPAETITTTVISAATELYLPLAPRQTGLTPRHRKRSDVASWLRCNPTQTK